MKQVLVIVCFISALGAMAQPTSKKAVKNNQTEVKANTASFADNYEAMKTSYIEELKTDSFYVTMPIVSQQPTIGRVQISQGVFKQHVHYPVIKVEGKWQYPPFTQEGFEKWLKLKTTPKDEGKKE